MSGRKYVRWRGFSEASGTTMPWVAAAAGADWGLALGRRTALVAGLSALVPIVAPELRADGERLRPAPLGGLVHLGFSIDLR